MKLEKAKAMERALRELQLRLNEAAAEASAMGLTIKIDVREHQTIGQKDPVPVVHVRTLVRLDDLELGDEEEE